MFHFYVRLAKYISRPLLWRTQAVPLLLAHPGWSRTVPGQLAAMNARVMLWHGLKSRHPYRPTEQSRDQRYCHCYKHNKFLHS